MPDTPSSHPAPSQLTRIAVYRAGFHPTSENLRTYLETHLTWHRTRRYHDVNHGPLTRRPQLRRALAAAQARSFDLLLIDNLRSLPRSILDVHLVLTTLDRAGVQLHVADHPHFSTTTATGQAMAAIVAALAEYTHRAEHTS